MKLTIVGVVADVPFESVDKGIQPAFYAPISQWRAEHAFLTVSTSGADMITPIREAIWSLDDTAPITRIAAMTDVVAAASKVTRHFTTLLGLFALLALLAVQ